MAGHWRRWQSILRPTPRGLFCLGLALFATAPAWIVRHPPLQDYPFHLATLRVLHDFGDPELHFRDFYELNLATQYLFPYLTGSLLAHGVGTSVAGVVLVCFYLAGTPLSIAALLRAFGRDERASVFSIPLLVNVMFIFGLLPYLLGIPLMFWATAWALRWFERVADDETPRRKLWSSCLGLGALTCALFFTHILPYALFGLAFAAMFPWRHPRRYLLFGLPVVPSLALVLWWVKTAAGRGIVTALEDQNVHPYDEAFKALSTWSVNVFADTSDERWFGFTILAMGLTAGLGQGDTTRDAKFSALRGYTLVPLACAVLYFTTGDRLGEVYMFAQRFPVPGLLTLVALVRIPNGLRGHLAAGLGGMVAVGATLNTCDHFRRFEREEVGDVEEAIGSMATGRKVAGLIFDRGSNVMSSALFAPFLHYVSYYQAARGGLVQFSYAHYKHWPFHYRDGHYPPPGQPAIGNWEWMPERVGIEELYPYYDYVLVRGPGFEPPPGTFRLRWRGNRWVVYERE